MVRLRVVLALASITGIATTSAVAQSGRDTTTHLVGIVVRKGTTVPIPNAAVGLATGRNLSATNDSGYFEGRNLPVGKTELRVRAPGFVPARLPIELRPGIVDTIRVELSTPPGGQSRRTKAP